MGGSVPVQIGVGRAGLTGLENMLDKEYGTWWRTRRALIHVFLWIAVINGFLFLVGIDEGRGNPFRALDELIRIFFQVGGLFATIGIVVTTQSAVLGERQMGTAEWVLSKPVTREAFLLAKLVVNGCSFLFLAVVIPSTVFNLQTLLSTSLQPSPLPFILGLAVHVAHLVFYLALTLALGTVLRSRGAIAGTAIGIAFAGLILPNFFHSLVTWTPWGLPAFAAQAAIDGSLPESAWQPILLTVLWTLLFVLAALWRFEREEF